VVAPAPPAVATITLTTDEHQALLSAGQDRGSAAGRSGPVVCWHCQKPGHVRFHCPARQAGVVAAGRPASASPPVADSVAPGSALLASAVGVPPAGPPASHQVLVCTSVVGEQVLAAGAVPVGVAIIDPGATATLVGADWLRAYLGALPQRMRRQAVRRPASVLFRFGDDRTTLADSHWFIPVLLGGTVRLLGTHVIPGPLPLLISRPSLRAAQAVLDLEADSLWLKDRHVSVPLVVDPTGHLTLSLLPPREHEALAAASRRADRRRSPPRSRATRSARTAAAESAREVGADQRMAAAAAAATAAAAEAAAAEAAEAAAPAVTSPAVAAPRPRLSPASPRPRAPRRRGAAWAATRQGAAAASGVSSLTGPSLAGITTANLPAALTHLHRMYAHPGADRLIHLLRAGGLTTSRCAALARQVTAACSTCRSLRP